MRQRPPHYEPSDGLLSQHVQEYYLYLALLLHGPLLRLPAFTLAAIAVLSTNTALTFEVAMFAFSCSVCHSTTILFGLQNPLNLPAQPRIQPNSQSTNPGRTAEPITSEPNCGVPLFAAYIFASDEIASEILLLQSRHIGVCLVADAYVPVLGQSPYRLHPARALHFVDGIS